MFVNIVRIITDMAGEDFGNRFQLAPTTATRFLMRPRKGAMLWIPVDKRTIYNNCVMCWKCLNQVALTVGSESQSVGTRRAT